MTSSHGLHLTALVSLLVASGCGSSSSSGGAGGGGGGASASSGATMSTGAGGQGGMGAGGHGPSGPVDASTIEGKLMMGYQGWFACPGDGAPPNRWVHWFGMQDPVATNATFDLWPDTSELDPDELFPTKMTLTGGGAASLYSAWSAKTVDRHFRWMAENGLDGVFLQRFLSELTDPAFLAFRDKVAANVRAGAEAHGRVFAIMYDVSGSPEATLVDDLKKDWAYLVDVLGLTKSPSYLKDGGRPVLAVWGLGYKDRPGTAAQAAAIVDFFRTAAGSGHVVTLMGGVPRDWRTLSGDSRTDPAWASVYRSFDILSPWTVGAFVDNAGADAYRTGSLAPDLAEAKASGLRYMPVVFPGFSWTNLNGGPLNQIPRKGGAFYWHQVYNALSAGSTMLYGAMFDEVDEGTAMFKIAPTKAALPAQGTFLSLDADGLALPSDFYLRLAGEATRRVRKEAPLDDKVPIGP
jgi:hypothetical protein